MEKIRVVELFAGVGGFRLGLEGWNGKSASTNYTEKIESNFEVVLSNQWEPSSKKEGALQEANSVYHLKWPNKLGSEHFPEDLSKKVSPEMTNKEVGKNIPDHDLLVGGFPCQDYSVAGVNTKGLEGKKGVLWWNIHKILEVKRPKYVFLENVDRLLKTPTNVRGRDFAIMLATLRDLDYTVEWRVINAADYGMPQRRRRVYILAYHSKSSIKIKKDKEWLFEEGIFAKAFPLVQKESVIEFDLNESPEEITSGFKNGKFLDAGIMRNGKVMMMKYDAAIGQKDFKKYSKSYNILKDVLIDKEKVPASFIVDGSKVLKQALIRVFMDGYLPDERLKSTGNTLELKTELQKWIYLKGKKAEQRVSSKGIFYYKEGPMNLTDNLELPSRTIITSEGGPGASRFKHLIEIKPNVYRRLVPEELERLNMFPTGHTALGKGVDKEVAIPDAKRAFFMGNALVVGIVEKIGLELAKRNLIK
jgi:DNA (cytosine-5)-methyltransferase 1